MIKPIFIFLFDLFLSNGVIKIIEPIGINVSINKMKRIGEKETNILEIIDRKIKGDIVTRKIMITIRLFERFNSNPLSNLKMLVNNKKQLIVNVIPKNEPAPIIGESVVKKCKNILIKK